MLIQPQKWSCRLPPFKKRPQMVARKMRRNYAVTVPNVNHRKKGGKRRLLGAWLTIFLTADTPCFIFSLARNGLMSAMSIFRGIP
ncbi:hypothetical protein [Desulfovibrio desulfuricans]|uniref:hypothetical protein n=1 Tax=Desulfovibrio desulfuricans TaxID=876 RepID=UPI00131E3251|nr:hypothetical protein [Desulfovibrio desulfuricans]